MFVDRICSHFTFHFFDFQRETVGSSNLIIGSPLSPFFFLFTDNNYVKPALETFLLLK